jgi:hypothetical protein
VTLGNAASVPPLHRWTVTCERATVLLENRSHDYIAGFRIAMSGLDGRPMPDVALAAEPGDGRINAFASLARRFVAAARDKAPCRPDFTSGARVQSWIAAIQSAAASGKQRCAS